MLVKMMTKTVPNLAQHVKRVRLLGTPVGSPDDLKLLIKSLPNVEWVEIGSKIKVTDAVLACMARKWTQLRYLSISDHTAHLDALHRVLSSNPVLTSLHFNCKLDGTVLHEIAFHSCASRDGGHCIIEELDINRPYYEPAAQSALEILHVVGQHFPELTRLSIDLQLTGNESEEAMLAQMMASDQTWNRLRHLHLSFKPPKRFVGQQPSNEVVNNPIDVITCFVSLMAKTAPRLETMSIDVKEDKLPKKARRSGIIPMPRPTREHLAAAAGQIDGEPGRRITFNALGDGWAP